MNRHFGPLPETLVPKRRVHHLLRIGWPANDSTLNFRPYSEFTWGGH